MCVNTRKNIMGGKLLVVFLCAGVSFPGIAETVDISAGTTNETTLSEMAANPVAEYALGDASAALVVRGTLAPSGGLASSVTFTNTVSGSGGHLVFDGSSFVDSYGWVSNDVFASWKTGIIVAEKLSLSLVTNVTGLLRYGNVNAPHHLPAKFYETSRSSTQLNFQMRAVEGSLVYCAKCQIAQVGDDLTVVVQRVGSADGVGIDHLFVDSELSNSGIASSDMGSGIGIYGCGVEWATKGAAMTVVLGGTNTTGEDGCVDIIGSPSVPVKATVTTVDALPAGGTVNVYDGGELDVNLPSATRIAATNLCVHPGGTIYLRGSYNVDANRGFHIDGGTLRLSSDGSAVEESYNRIYHLTLSNGARVTGGSPICCTWDRFYCTVTGSSPSYCDAILRLNADADSRFAYFDVDDVTGDEAADFIVNRPIVKSNANAVCTTIQKRRPGTMLLAAANSYPHQTSIIGGTLKFGVSDCLPSTNAVQISGGAALAVADTTTNTLGLVSFERGTETLVLGENAQLSISTVELASGASVFLDGSFAERSLRIGNSACLSKAELAAFSCESGVNGRVVQTSDGWIRPRMEKGFLMSVR